MLYNEDQLLPISALQHLLFCERQCALIHIERLWVDNVLTAEGNHLHRNAHESPSETRDGLRITRGLSLRSYQYGLMGQADVITWKPPDEKFDSSLTLPQIIQRAHQTDFTNWEIVPIEYKRGRPKKNDCDRVQLCAQALCLEEMLGIKILSGDLFYGEKRRRFNVDFDVSLRATTEQAAIQLHLLITNGVTPAARKEKKCEKCSLINLCLPGAANPNRSAERFLNRSLTAHLSSTYPVTDNLLDD